MPPRTSVKEVHREKKREGDRQEAEKKRQQDKDAKVETLRKQAAASPARADEEMEECAVSTVGNSGGTTAGRQGKHRPSGVRPMPCAEWRPNCLERDRREPTIKQHFRNILRL